LHVYSFVQIELLVGYVIVWQSTHLKLLLLTLRRYLSCLCMLVLCEIQVLMLVVTLLELIHHLILYLAPWLYMFVIY
jgi:hypothetical protein